MVRTEAFVITISAMCESCAGAAAQANANKPGMAARGTQNQSGGFMAGWSLFAGDRARRKWRTKEFQREKTEIRCPKSERRPNPEDRSAHGRLPADTFSLNRT